MRFSVLASGSSGNACYVESDSASILIDAGLSCSELIRRLHSVGVDPEGLDALLLTHEHTDHIKGAGPISRRLDLPVYVNHLTLQRGMKVLGNLSMPVILQTGQAFTVNGLHIETFTKCHDAADPIGVILSSEGFRLGMITDLGRSTRLVEDRLKGCQALIIEFNHDEQMLENGPYPLDLKRRIRGPEGHLSNSQAAELLQVLAHASLEVVVLAHLSPHNNLPQKALDAVKSALVNSGLSHTKVLVSRQHDPLAMVEMDGA